MRTLYWCKSLHPKWRKYILNLSLLNKEAWILLLLLGVQKKSNQKTAIKESVMFHLRPTGQGAVKIINSWFGWASITTCISWAFSPCQLNSPCELKLWFSSWSHFHIHRTSFWCFGASLVPVLDRTQWTARFFLNGRGTWIK